MPERFQFVAKRLPICLVGGALALFFGVQTFDDSIRITATRRVEKGPAMHCCLKIETFGLR